MQSDIAHSILESLRQVVLLALHRSDPETGQTDFFIEYANPEWEHLAGSERSTITGKNLRDSVYIDSGIPWHELGELAHKQQYPVDRIVYSPFFSKWLDITVTCLDYPRFCFYIHDVTEQKTNESRLKQQNQRLSSLSGELASSKNNLKTKLEKIENLNIDLEKLAYNDTLSGLPNRSRFSAMVSEELERANVAGKRLVLALLDIDNLKHLNDSLGHDAGDELIKQLARRLKNFEQYQILSGRFGGDEFLLIIKECEQDMYLVQLIKSLQEMLHAPYRINDTEVKATVSIGVSTYPEDALTAGDLIKYADIAAMEAKKRGKNTMVLFHADMQAKLVSRVTMEQRLHSAMQNDLFSLVYQSQYDTSTGKLRGFEALVRWNDPELGKVLPEHFIPVAEENRFIIPLGQWILEKACLTLKDWNDRYGFEGIMSINVSPVQIQHPQFIENLYQAVSKAGVVPSSVEIEITEGVLIRDFSESIKILHEVTQLGIGIALDDFGTGYSSLSYLRQIPLTTLKIDRSFIANIRDAKGIEYDIIEAIVSLVNKLGIDTVAEGVETEEQFEAIKKLKCKTVQGFLTGKPLAADACERLFTVSERYSASS